jgi:hypothetical protein
MIEISSRDELNSNLSSRASLNTLVGDLSNTLFLLEFHGKSKKRTF